MHPKHRTWKSKHPFVFPENTQSLEELTEICSKHCGRVSTISENISIFSCKLQLNQFGEKLQRRK